MDDQSRRDGWKEATTQSSFSRPCGTKLCFMMYPGLASWAKFSRAYGTKFVNPGSHARSVAQRFRPFARHGEHGAPAQGSRPDLITSSVVTQPSRSGLCRNYDGLIKRRGARFQPANIGEACRMQCLVQV